jgi:anti-anti-sigma regulatory factor
MSDFNIKVREEGDIIILETSGYLNNFGGDRVASICKQSISEGKRKLLINMENTKMVNSIGVSILIEVIEDLQGVNGTLGYYNVASHREESSSQSNHQISFTSNYNYYATAAVVVAAVPAGCNTSAIHTSLAPPLTQVIRQRVPAATSSTNLTTSSLDVASAPDVPAVFIYK